MVIFFHMEMEYQRITHPIPPFFNENSKVLVLGSFPSVKSREQKFFYGHPQNRFWKVLSALKGAFEPKSIEEKKALLLDLKVAVWDVIKECDIVGSADSTIKNVAPNDIAKILENSQVETICVNGKTAKKYYDKYIKPTLGIEAICLPSTSPANAVWSIEKLIDSWKVILK